MPNVKEIIDKMDSPTASDTALIKKAYVFAEEAHKDHERFSGEPYFVHLHETAKSLAETGMGSETIAAGLLHDTIEDTNTTPEDIQETFGDEILHLVQGVTKLGALRYQGLERHIESLRKLFVATSQDIRVLIIKLMDRLHNMKTLEHVPKEKQKRIALETLEIYVPIADRLGMGRIKRELEDLAFPYVYTKEFEEINLLFKKKNKETLQRLDKMHKALKRVLGEHDIRNFKTEHRIKGLYSLYQKLERKDWDLEKIHDILAIRIVVPTVADCYTVFGTIHSVWKPLPGKIKDYIAFPKPNGYQSLHTTVFTKEGGIVEIQIRTEEMHRRAQFGIASHLAYKESGGRKRPQQYIKFANEWLQQLLPSILRFNTKNNTKQKSAKKEDPQSKSMQVPTWIRDIAESHQAEAGEEFLDNLKSDFFSHRVFVFTPKGDVIDLPISSSTIDFAYTIHSDIGNHTFGAKVNGKLVSLDTELHNGDIVEILTRPSSHPTNRWLEFAKTTAARKHIRIALDAQQKLNTR